MFIKSVNATLCLFLPWPPPPPTHTSNMYETHTQHTHTYNVNKHTSKHMWNTHIHTLTDRKTHTLKAHVKHIDTQRHTHRGEDRGEKLPSNTKVTRLGRKPGPPGHRLLRSAKTHRTSHTHGEIHCTVWQMPYTASLITHQLDTGSDIYSDAKLEREINDTVILWHQFLF